MTRKCNEQIRVADIAFLFILLLYSILPPPFGLFTETASRTVILSPALTPNALVTLNRIPKFCRILNCKHSNDSFRTLRKGYLDFAESHHRNPQNLHLFTCPQLQHKRYGHFMFVYFPRQFLTLSNF